VSGVAGAVERDDRVVICLTQGEDKYKIALQNRALRATYRGNTCHSRSPVNRRPSRRQAKGPLPASCVGLGVPEAGIKKYLLRFARIGSWLRENAESDRFSSRFAAGAYEALH
jgi:hypothetical protein